MIVILFSFLFPFLFKESIQKIRDYVTKCNPNCHVNYLEKNWSCFFVVYHILWRQRVNFTNQLVQRHSLATFSFTNKTTLNFVSTLEQLEFMLNFYYPHLTTRTCKIDIKLLGQKLLVEHWWNWTNISISEEIQAWNTSIKMSQQNVGYGTNITWWMEMV